MRNIPESLKAKMRLMSQTSANNADPRLDAIISRHVISIQEYKMWQTSKVADFSGRVSIAVPRPDHRKMPESILVGGIDTGAIKIYQAKFDGINAPELWNKVLELSGVVDFSMAYVGKFRPWKKGTEFYTPDEYPWIVWTDSDKNLWAQYWDDTDNKALIGTNVTSCSVSMGINSVQDDWGYGLLVSWTTLSGSVFYAQYFDDVWSEGILMTHAPANAVDVVISRVADVRMVFLVKDSSGSVTEMLFRSIAISLSNVEQVQVVSTKVIAGTTPVEYHDTSVLERIEVTEVEAVLGLLSVLPPNILSVTNCDDGLGNFGLSVVVAFKEPVYGFEDQQVAFSLIGESGQRYYCQAVVRGSDLNTLTLTMQDFNNAPGVCTLSYTPGTLQGGITLAPALSKTFLPTGLIPTVIPTPVALSAINLDNSNSVLVVEFDLNVSSTDFSANTDAFVISGFEPLHVPKDGSADVAKTYAVTSVLHPPVLTLYRDTLGGDTTNVTWSGTKLSLVEKAGA